MEHPRKSYLYNLWGYLETWIEAWESELTVTPEMIKNWISYVITHQDSIIGFWCREPTERHYSDGLLFIDPDYIGQGCGAILWKNVMREAKARGLKSLTWVSDPNALNFYLKMGAVKIGEESSQILTLIK